MSLTAGVFILIILAVFFILFGGGAAKEPLILVGLFVFFYLISSAFTSKSDPKFSAEKAAANNKFKQSFDLNKKFSNIKIAYNGLDVNEISTDDKGHESNNTYTKDKLSGDVVIMKKGLVIKRFEKKDVEALIDTAYPIYRAYELGSYTDTDHGYEYVYANNDMYVKNLNKSGEFVRQYKNDEIRKVVRLVKDFLK